MSTETFLTKLYKKMQSLRINGINIQGGRSVIIADGKVIIDGKDVTKNLKLKETILHIEVTGAINELNTDASVSCNNVGRFVNARGSVNCDNVGGNVHAGGSVNCAHIAGNVTAGGSINC